jgi:mannose-6-phosphate isomerase-like protein (cupin superfamily)
MIEPGVPPLVRVPRGTMRRTSLVILVMLLVLAQTVMRSQSGIAQRPAVDISNAAIRATIGAAPADAVMDQQIRVVDIGAYNVAVGVLHRAANARQTAISHAQVTEVYHIIDGAGTFVTGGEMLEATPSPSDGNTVKVLVGPSTGGTSVRGGQSRRVGPGDVIVIPPGVAHWFSAVESDMNYLVIRIDAGHVLPAGYVNPAVTPTAARWVVHELEQNNQSAPSAGFTLTVTRRNGWKGAGMGDKGGKKDKEKNKQQQLTKQKQEAQNKQNKSRPKTW